MGWYKQGVVQWPKKSWKGCEKRCEIVKKVWNTKKNCLKLIENDISMIKNGFLNFCIFQWKLHMSRLSEFSSIFYIIKEIYENEKVF